MTRGAAGPIFHGPALLFCPGDRPERFTKAAAAADSVILDLEDAVDPDAKDTAREVVLGGLGDLDPDRALVRVNARDTPWHTADMKAFAAHPDLVLMLPMTQRPEDVEALAPHPVVALCETALGVLHAPEIAAVTNCRAVMWGSEDLVADLGGRRGRVAGGGYYPAVEEARTRVLYAARAAHVLPIDTVLIDIDDLVTLESDSVAACTAGYVAKACIHPKQVAPIRRAFLPSADQVSWAQDVLEAATYHPGVFRFRGQMIDVPVLAHAQLLLRQASGVSNA